MIRHTPPLSPQSVPVNDAESQARAPFSPGSQWVKLFQHRFLQMVDGRFDGRKITLRILRVYLVLICHMNRRNYVLKSQKDLASIIGMSAQAFSAALRQLEDLGYLVRVGGRDKSRKIMLCPFFVAMGSQEDGTEVEGEFSRLQQKLQEELRNKHQVVGGKNKPIRKKRAAREEATQSFSL